MHDFLTVAAPTPLQHAGAVALVLPDEYYRSMAVSISACAIGWSAFSTAAVSSATNLAARTT